MFKNNHNPAGKVTKEGRVSKVVNLLSLIAVTILVIGTILPVKASSFVPAPVGPGIYDDTNTTVWTYSGTWTTYIGAGPYNNSLHDSNTAGSYAEVTFSGIKFILTYLKSSGRGSIGVYIDGKKVTTIDPNGTLTWQVTWTSPTLSAGTHTARFQNAGGGWIDLDAIEITSSSTTGGTVLVGAGDISTCSNNYDEATAKLIDNIPGTVFTAGDDAYPSGTAANFTNCYNPTWGRFKSRTAPVPGNHEYNTSGASGYFNYFNNISSYYAYNLGSWRIYALNSEIDISATSAEVKWLKADLAANPHQCVLAIWHEPRWSSGSTHGSSTKVQTLWSTLYNAGAELVLNGHDHEYERFAPMNASGSAASSGMREFVVGTGGADLYSFGKILPASQVHNSSTHGVLKLTLNPTSYSWKFVPVAGKTFTDSGTTNCH